jgi:uncharacterized protein (DUF1778 family)
MKAKKRLQPEEVRSENIKFRATPAQKHHIEEQAHRTGMTVSDYVLARAYSYEPKLRTTGLEDKVYQELALARTDYKRYFGMLEGMNDEQRRQMFKRERWMTGALSLLDAQRRRIDYILNNIFGRNKLPPRTSKTLKTKSETDDRPS